MALTVVGGLIPGAILVYGAYWAFAVRHALFARPYRSQALWLGFFSLYLLVFVSSLDSAALALNNPYASVAATLYYVMLALLLFRLVDVDMGVARRSDPLLRDTLHWRQLRVVVWAIIAPSAVLVVYLAISLFFKGSSLLGFDAPPQVLIAAEASNFLPFLLSGGPALLIAARRSRDATFQRSLKWFGIFFLLLLVTFVVYSATASGLVQVPSDIFNATGGFAFVPAAYCLYRSARSLAPLARIRPSEVG